MTEPIDAKVAVYIDFDNIVISRYNDVHGKDKFAKDGARYFHELRLVKDPAAKDKLEKARVDLSALLDYASSLGTVAISRAYADWSLFVNARYQGQLLDRAVELVQLFPTAARSKNGADIRLAVDVIEDLFRLQYITHVVIVAGDSDYVPLAQRCRRLGRRVVGIGVASTTATVLKAACDQFVSYEDLHQLSLIAEHPEEDRTPAREGEADAAEEHLPDWERELRRAVPAGPPPVDRNAPPALAALGPATDADVPPVEPAVENAGTEVEPSTRHDQAVALLRRSIRLMEAARGEEWAYASSVKTQMQRIDPSFSERTLGYPGFLAFVRSAADEIEIVTEPGGPPKLRFVVPADPS